MTDLLKAILVDDELSSLQNLQQKLQEYCPSVKVIAAVQKPEEAILLIRHHKPDVLFLDIEMPKMSGFRLLEELGDYEAEIIFTTAYNHFAIEAMRISAFDYLVKPVAIADLQQAVNRLAQQRTKQTRERLNILRKSITETKNQENKIAVPTNEGLEFIVIKNIIRIESSSSYSRIYLVNGQSLFVTRLLKDFEELLLPYRFFRVHNSHLINLSYIRKYIRGEGGQVVMENGDLVDVSRRKKEEFLSLLNG
ncbi:MAG TPA: LytTR family DNA-binding domain-containing protein [Puia sp.]|nr:LytTR family DNA-binding domain-containing protein [Puia sp.]